MRKSTFWIELRFQIAHRQLIHTAVDRVEKPTLAKIPSKGLDKISAHLGTLGQAKHTCSEEGHGEEKDLTKGRLFKKEGRGCIPGQQFNI